jgi:lysyl-tRNA synthetase class 2
VLLNKTLRPLPDKYHGLTDQEARYRQRYLDLIMNDASRDVFRMRSRIVHEIRQFFMERGFLEVETPMMHAIPGGAAARPFVTHHNALDIELYLRIAPELFLKRLVVGGFEQVFEINRNFRNEGLSARHTPEFTMLEFYWAYHDYQDLIALTSELLATLAQRVLGATRFTWQNHEFDFGVAPSCMTMLESIVRFAGVDEADAREPGRLAAVLASWNLEVPEGASLAALQVLAFETRVEERLIEPVFITGYPTEISPLSRPSDLDPNYSERFELFIGGREIANGFSELNDPLDQAARFREQAARREAGDLEAMHYDQDYVTALEYGLPPTAGEGIGIDRLVMLFAGATSIRDVLLFPLLRPRDE